MPRTRRLLVVVPLFLEAAELITLPQRLETLLFYAFVALLVGAALGIPTLLIVLAL